MKKIYSGRYPTLEENQFDLNRTLISMLNCRSYLNNQGFQEVTGYDIDVNGIAGGYAEIVFPDGVTLSHDNFQKTIDRDSLLESMISRGVILRPHNNYDSEERLRVITSTFKRNGYQTHLAIRDTTKKKLGFFRGIGHEAELFTFVYNLELIEDVVRDSDIKQFAKYQQGLEDSIRQDTLLTYTPQVPQKRQSKSQEAEIQKVETDFINPWEIEIPKLGKND